MDVTTGAARTILHFTHVKNLEGIRDRGLLADNRVKAAGEHVIECADQGIKSSRRDKPIKVPPFGVVADYVPFYFAPRSPMMYVISKGSVPGYTEGLDPLVYLVSTSDSIIDAGLAWVGSDGNCAATLTEHYTKFSDMEDAVDWPLMDERMWRNTPEDGDRMRRRAAEFLVHKRVPFRLIHGVVARTEATAEYAKGVLLGKSSMVKINRQWYY